MKCQPRLKRPRKALASCVSEQIKAAVERDTRRWDCSRSWIIATTLAAFYNIDIMAPYEAKNKKKGPKKI